ncbi:MAG TPA: YjgN family protein [Steroidobacteraceae bacterium]|jgi:uncharacterized membrane protein YjgN (DUF898 family)|nr:YjgN family protein [Steroidobacteraceae bacterium]
MDQGTEGESHGGSPAAVAPEPVRFTGSGAEYFGIWIVNLLLTIVTVGIYSAWAKVRRLQYFYRHTELAGSSFDFHGSAVKILIGRLVALVMLIAYNYTIRIQSVWTLAVIGGIALIMPWMLRNSLRFRLYNTSWRGVRFHFRGTVARTYRVFLLYGILSLVTLYILAPFMHQRVKAYQHNNSWFGQTQCSFHARAGQFYKIYLLLLAAMVAFVFLLGFSGVFGAFAALAEAQKHGHRINPYATFKALAILYGALIIMGVSIGPVFRALMTNLIWSNTRVGEHRIECSISPLGLIWISVSNLVLVALTLGLFMPWASVRMAKFQLEAVRLVPAGDLQQFVDAEPDQIGAVGEEAASAFDFDISL